MFVYAYVCICMCGCMCGCMFVCMHVCMYVHILLPGCMSRLYMPMAAATRGTLSITADTIPIIVATRVSEDTTDARPVCMCVCMYVCMYVYVVRTSIHACVYV